MSARIKPGIVYENGKAVKVIIDIRQYQKMLEELEDVEDLKALREIRRKPASFRKLDDYLAEKKRDV